MITSIHKSHNRLSYRIFSTFIAFTFIFSLVLPPGYAQLIPQTLLNLPAPGTMVTPTAGFTPALINGITIHPENPLEFDFIVGTGDENLQGQALEEESTKLIKYFLASLTVPEDEMWVNLSPYEKDRIIPEGFGVTEMGRDLLAQDYILKQLTASLMYPEKELGSEFWKKIYQRAYEEYGTTEIPVNTFNKVWIVPEKAIVYEHGQSAFVVKSHLKVMLEEDYLAMQQESSVISLQSSVSSTIIKEIILPAIEKEVNEGKSFANLRQIYNSAILATWFKQNLKETLLGQVYVDKAKTKGVDVEDRTVNQKIYEQYLEAFKKGVYNYIKEDYDSVTQEIIPRKYFSGGTNLKVGDLVETYRKGMSLTRPQQEIVGEYLAGLKDYNQGIVRVNLVELSEDMSVAEAWKLIQESQQHVSTPAEVEEVKEDVLVRIKEARRLLEGLSAKVEEGIVPSGINILKYTALLNALRAASLKEGGGKDAGVPAASLLNITERKNLGSRIQGILATLNGNTNTSEEDKQEITTALNSLQESLKRFKSFENVIFQEASLDEQLKKVSRALNLPEVNVFYALRNAVDKEKLADGLTSVLGMTSEDGLRERMTAAGMIYSIGDKYILRPYFVTSSRIKKIVSGIPAGIRGRVETTILDSVDANNFIAGLAWDSKKSEEEIVQSLEGQKRLSPLAERWRSFYARESDEAALRETVERANGIAGDFIKSHPAESGEFVLAVRVAPNGKSAVVTTAVQSPSGNNERASRILLLDLSQGAEGVRVPPDKNNGRYHSPLGRITFFNKGKAVAVWNFFRQLKWDIREPENPKPIGWQEEETWAREISSSPLDKLGTSSLRQGRSSSPVEIPEYAALAKIAKKYSLKGLANDNFVFVYKDHAGFLEELVKQGYGEVKIWNVKEEGYYPNVNESTPNKLLEQRVMRYWPGMIIISKNRSFNKYDLPTTKEIVYQMASQVGEVDKKTGEVEFRSEDVIAKIARLLSANGFGDELIRDEYGKEIAPTKEIDPFFDDEYQSDEYIKRHTTYQKYTIDRYDPWGGRYGASGIILVFKKDGSITQYYKISGGAQPQETKFPPASSPVEVVAGAADDDEGGTKHLRIFVEEALAEDLNYSHVEDLIRDLTNILVERKHDTPASLEAVLSAINFIVTEHSDIVLFIPSDLEDAMDDDEVKGRYDPRHLETVKQLLQKTQDSSVDDPPEALGQFTSIIEAYLGDSGTASSPVGASEDADDIIDRIVDYSQTPGSPAAELLKREPDYSGGVEKISADQEIISDNRVPGASPAGVHGPDEKVGGIDLNPALLDLQIKRDANGVPLPLPQQPIENMHIEGFLPIIINITPVTNLPMLLGLADAAAETQAITATPDLKTREVEPVSLLN